MDENRQSGSNLDNDRRWTVCDYCYSELALDDVELEQGWYMCPECDQLSHLVEIVGDSPDYSQRVGPEVVADVEAVEDGPKAKPRESDAEWVKLKTATGPEEAALEVSYLRANGIEAVAWQEGAGRAFGLTLGSLGASHIMVREDQEQLARSILEAEAEGSSDYDGADNDSISDASKAVLGLTAVVLNPIGAGLAFGISQIMRGRDKDAGAYKVDCIYCNAPLELSDQEIEQGHFICPECQHPVQLRPYAVCPSCQTELLVDETELRQGWYRCPECDRVAQL